MPEACKLAALCVVLEAQQAANAAALHCGRRNIFAAAAVDRLPHAAAQMAYRGAPAAVRQVLTDVQDEVARAWLTAKFKLRPLPPELRLSPVRCSVSLSRAAVFSVAFFLVPELRLSPLRCHAADTWTSSSRGHCRDGPGCGTPPVCPRSATASLMMATARQQSAQRAAAGGVQDIGLTGVKNRTDTQRKADFTGTLEERRAQYARMRAAQGQAPTRIVAEMRAHTGLKAAGARDGNGAGGAAAVRRSVSRASTAAA